MFNPSLMLISKFKKTLLTEKVNVKANVNDGTTCAFALKQCGGSPHCFHLLGFTEEWVPDRCSSGPLCWITPSLNSETGRQGNRTREQRSGGSEVTLSFSTFVFPPLQPAATPLFQGRL